MPTPLLLPGPGLLGAAAAGWDGKAWAGAALYLLLFAAAILGIWVLLRGSPGRDSGDRDPPGPGGGA